MPSSSTRTSPVPQAVPDGAAAPSSAAGIEPQRKAAWADVLAVPCLDWAVLVVTGRDRVSWLNGLLTCDLATGPVAQGRYGLFVGRNGRILADARIVFSDTEALVSVPRAVVAALRPHLEHYLVMEDAEIAERVDGFEPWMLHGPRSDDLLAVMRGAGAIGGSLDATGLGGAIVFVPTERRVDVLQALEKGLRDVGGLVGDDAGWEALRLERGIPRFGRDFDETTYPQEARLEATAVSFKKGCYLGQEVICMLELRGHVRRHLVSLVLEAGDPPPRGSPVINEAGEPLGEITSAARSPSPGVPSCMAMLRRASAQPGQSVRVGGLAGRVVVP